MHAKSNLLIRVNNGSLSTLTFYNQPTCTPFTVHVTFAGGFPEGTVQFARTVSPTA